MTRNERIERANELRGRGLTLQAIADDIGAARSTVFQWLTDPDGAENRARKKRYCSPCVECGQLTSWPTGGTRYALRCGKCAKRFQHESRYWTPERVIDALHEWARELGRTPSAAMALTRGAPVGCAIVQREFGSWSAGLAAAGLAPNPIGAPSHARAA